MTYYECGLMILCGLINITREKVREKSNAVTTDKCCWKSCLLVDS